MPISMKLEFTGADHASMVAYAQRYGTKLNAAVGAGMKAGGRELLAAVRADYARSVNLRRTSFPKAISTKLFDKKPGELPALLIGSRVPAIAAHAFGANIPGPVLIPLLDNGARIGRKKFALLIRALIAQGNAEFRRVNGRTLVFAEAGAAAASGLNLGAFRRAERARRGGKFRKARGRTLEVPIAMLVRNVVVRPRFAFVPGVRSGLPLITAAIQRELDRL